MANSMQQQQHTTFGSVSQIFFDLLHSLTSCLSCFSGSAQLKVNGRKLKLQHLLGEGGFSYVYLVSDVVNQKLYALKKIRCPFGQESVSLALKEVEAYTLFSPHPNIIHAVDHAVVSADDRNDPASKTVYILLPYYRKGNLQDAINANLVNHTKFPEDRLLVIFLGVARALKALHQYRVRRSPGGSKSVDNARAIRSQANKEDRASATKSKSMKQSKTQKRKDQSEARSGDDDMEQEPLMEGEITMAQDDLSEGDLRAYAHRDIKPGNIMISDDGKTPILMDFGSLAPSPVVVGSRSTAIQIQDQAAEHSTMPYRAPELFDVKTDTIVDTKVDIWSLGCTIFACLVGKSPFEMRSDETGGSLSMCVLGGDWRFPDEGRQHKNGGAKGKGKRQGPSNVGSQSADMDLKISDPIKDIVRQCLNVEPNDRPDIDQVIQMIQQLISPSSAATSIGEGS